MSSTVSIKSARVKQKHKVAKEKKGKRKKVLVNAASKLIQILNLQLSDLHTKLEPYFLNKKTLMKFFRKFSTISIQTTKIENKGIFNTVVQWNTNSDYKYFLNNKVLEDNKDLFDSLFNKEQPTINITLAETDNIKLNLTVVRDINKFTGVYNIIFSIPSEMYSFVIKKTGEEGSEAIIKDIMNAYWVDGSIPPIYDLDYEIEGELLFTGPTKLGSGDIVYLPSKKEMPLNNREEFFKKIKETGEVPKSFIIMIDPKTETLYQTNSSGKIKNVPLKGAMKMVDEDIKPFLEKKIHWLLNTEDPKSLARIWDFYYYYFTEEEKKKIIPHYSKTIGEFYDSNPNECLDFLNLIKKKYDEHKKDLVPYTRLHFAGVFQTIYRNIKDHKSIAKRVNDKREHFNRADISDLPAIPYMRQDGFYFPHQAKCITQLNIAGETAILDVSTGGGKTVIQISDALLNLSKNKNSRILLVMPGSLIGQFIGEINYFTKGQINAIALTTETMASWGRKKLEKICEEAPVNSIFLTTYSFLTNGSISFELGGTKFKQFPNVDWIKEHVRPTYISCDESHFIKRASSSRSQAIMNLRNSNYRRIATGTLIMNNPGDLSGQIALLDPLAVGDRSEFAYRYAKEFDSNTGKVYKWKPDAADLIRNDLRNNTYYMMYREKDWAALLPDMEKEYFLVDFLTDTQKKVYEAIVKSTLEEISQDPDLKAAWEAFCEIREGDDDEFMSAPLLAKFAKMEQYLTAPDRSEFVEKGMTDKDKLSPKMAIIDERIKKSIDAGYKCIVAVHFKKSALHLFENSKFKNVSAYYDASHKDNIIKFKTDPKCKVLFAVCQSISEGHNLQVADRIIIADNDWTDGKLKQLVARIFRPNVKADSKTKKLENLNKNKKVYIDYVLCDGTADVAKFCYQTYKKVFNASVMEGCPVRTPNPPNIDPEALTASFTKMMGKDYLAIDKEFQTWFMNQVQEEKKKGDLIPVKMKVAKPLPGSKEINVPWVKGMPLPVSDGQIPLEDYMEDNGIEINSKQDKKLAKNKLKGAYVRTQYGYGTIIRVGLKSVTIKDEDGEEINEPFDKVILLKEPKTTKEGKDKSLKLSKKSKEEAKDLYGSSVYLTLAVFNELPLLIVDSEDPDSDVLKGQFKKQGPYWYVKVKSKPYGNRLLRILQKKFDIKQKRIDEIEHFINSLTTERKKLKIPSDLKTFYKIKHTVADKGSLKVYPLIINNNLFVVVDKKTHPGVNLTKYGFKLDEGYWYLPCKTSGKLNLGIKFIQKKNLGIPNLNEVKEDAKNIGFRVSIKSSEEE